MSSPVLCAVILLACAVTFSAAQTSCGGRCGAEYYRGYMCQCDYNCLSYGECCKDFESQCTTKNSCKGRCGENFKRGRLCSCDSDCIKYNQCCSDYTAHCDADEQINGAASATAPGKTNSCQNVNDNKPKEPTLNEATEQDSFSEGNNADDPLIPLVSPTSYPQDDLSDDMYGQIFPSEYPNNGMEDPEASPIPESTSGYGSSTPDLLDHMSVEPTQYPDTLEISAEPTQYPDALEISAEPTQYPDALEISAEPTQYPDALEISAEPTQYPDALELSTETFTAVSQPEMTGSDNEPTQANDLPSTLTEEAPTQSSDAGDPTSLGTTVPQPTTAPDHDSSQPAQTSEPETAFSPTASSPELEVGGQAEAQLEYEVLPEAQNIDPSVVPSDEPDVTTTAGYPPVDLASTGPTEASQVTVIPDSSAQGQTAIPEATALYPGADHTDINTEDVTAGPEDPAGSDDLTTHIPTSTEAVQDDVRDVFTSGVTTADSLNVTPEPTKPSTSEATSKPQDKPQPYKPLPAKPVVAKPAVAKPGSRPEAKPLDAAQTLNVEDPRDFQADDSNDTNLCSGRPVSAVTTLRNGTIVVFRGHYFWFLDRNRVPGPARGITQVWGVPSPIDTVFTRCNCQGKTYIFKGAQYWRFENDVLDTGYPKLIETGFDGLRGHITAALSVPQYQRRRESVYFFKRGGLVQKYSYQYGPSPTCGRKVQYAVYTVHNRVARQAVSLLGPTVNIRTTWRGFPSTITAAVSIPTNREPEGYKYYVFSRSKSYNVRMDGERPVIAAPAANTSPQSNNVFKCPKKV